MAWIRQKSGPDAPADGTTQPAPRAAEVASQRETTRETTMEKHVVNIGQSVQIKGELTGNEDLTIEGMVDGKITVKDHNLTIGANGRITAEVHAKTVNVVGQVIGNIIADDKVELAPTGSVQGDIRAPRVAIADGARFKGSIDMERKASASSRPMVATPTASASGKSGGMSTPAAPGMPRSAKG